MDRTNGAGHVAGQFVAEDLATNRPPTEITADWLNGVQEELIAVLLAANVQPDRLKLNQLKLALDATYLAKNGTSPILQNFAGLTRSVTPLGGGLLREYVDIANAATVGGLEIGNVYNCAVDAMTGVWAGRDIADFCWLEKWHDTAGTKEFWFAPTAAAGTVPVWQKVFALDMVGGGMYLAQEAGHVAFFARSTAPAGYLKANGALISRATYGNLFANIGTTFGVGDGLTTFALPDLRGEFIRGFDDARGVDAARALGSAQVASSVSNFAHADAVAAGALSAIFIGVTNADAAGPVLTIPNANYYMSAASAVNGGVLYSGSSSVRPRNIALLACIKY